MPDTTLTLERAASLPAALSVAILAGGLGTRLRSVVGERPKVLAPVGGRPFLAWWLRALGHARVKEVVLCIGYQGAQVRACFGAAHAGVRLKYSVEHEPLGTGGALCQALRRLEGETLLAFNGDSFCEVNIEALWATHHAQRASVTMALTRVEDTRRFGRVVVTANGRVTAFEEKGTTPGPGWINAGIYLIRRRLLEAEPAGARLSLERELLPRWLPLGVQAFPAMGRFIDIGTPESYARADAFFAEADSDKVAA